MLQLADYLELFMEKTGYPEDSKDTFRDVNQKILADAEAVQTFDALTQQFKEYDRDVLQAADVLGQKLGIHEYTIELFLFMYQSYFLRERYRTSGIDESIFWDSMTDLRAKLVECRDVYGINGSFVAGWFFGFFEMERFALGRLQFEITEYNKEEPYVCGDAVLRMDDQMVNMHIPSLGPLTKEKMLDAFRRAFVFPMFQPLLDKKTGWMPFCCGSWLLYPPHREFLPPHSNILKFMDCFDIIERTDWDEFHDDWRVFGKYKDAAPADLPRDTSLRKAYADRLLSGGKTGSGFGIFFFDGERIIHPDTAGAATI